MIVLNVSALSVHHLSLIRMPNKDRENTMKCVQTIRLNSWGKERRKKNARENIKKK